MMINFLTLGVLLSVLLKQEFLPVDDEHKVVMAAKVGVD